jgi:hypothetical protein
MKSMLVIFFDCEGIVHQEFVSPQQTVKTAVLPGGIATPE